MSNTKIILGSMLLVGIIGATVYFRGNRSTNSESGTVAEQEQAATAKLPDGLSAQEYQQAAEWYRDRYAGKEPSREDVLAMAGELAFAEQRFQTAIACYRAIPTTDETHGLKARLDEGLALIKLNQVADAEAVLRTFLDAARLSKSVAAEDVITAFKWLNFILSVEIRQEDRRVLLAEMHQIGIADPFDSKQFFFPNLLILNSPTGRTRLKQFIEQDPQNLELRVAQVRYLTLEGKFELALEMAEGLYKEHPQNAVVLAATGEALFELGDTQRLRELLTNFAPYVESEPWVLTRLRGEMALEDKQTGEALRYFQAVLAQDPAHAPCQMGVARALAEQGDTEGQKEALRKSKVLAEIRVNLSSVQTDAPAAATELAQKCEAIGLQSAATFFHQHALAISSSQSRGNQ